MNCSRVATLTTMLALSGCVGTLPELGEKTGTAASSSAPLDVLGAPGGYQVRNLTVTVPNLSCGGKSYPETRNAFLGGFKRAYIESWNGVIESQRLGVLTATTPAQKKRRDYLTSHMIEWTKDAQDAMTDYEVKPTRITADNSPHDPDPAVRDAYQRAACIRSAYHGGSSEGRRRAQDEVRVVLDKAPSGQ